jgi:hypothetical protein
MPVMEIGPMGVAMNEGLVFVLVGVPGWWRQARVTMVVVAVVMAVGMLVVNGFVGVLVGVALSQEEGHGADEEDGGRGVHPGEGFAEKYNCKRNAKKWCAREKDLGAGGTKGLGGSDVEDDARSIGDSAHREGRCEHLPTRREGPQGDTDG